MTRYLQVIASVSHYDKIGGETIVQVPTFYLDTGVQGIENFEQAGRIIRRVINPTQDVNIAVHYTISEMY